MPKRELFEAAKNPLMSRGVLGGVGGIALGLIQIGGVLIAPEEVAQRAHSISTKPASTARLSALTFTSSMTTPSALLEH